MAGKTTLFMKPQVYATEALLARRVKWTPKSSKIDRRRCHNGRDSAMKVHKGVPRGSGQPGHIGL